MLLHLNKKQLSAMNNSFYRVKCRKSSNDIIVCCMSIEHISYIIMISLCNNFCRDRRFRSYIDRYIIYEKSALKREKFSCKNFFIRYIFRVTFVPINDYVSNVMRNVKN